MTRWLAAYAGAVLVIAWAVLTAWHHLRRPRMEPRRTATPEFVPVDLTQLQDHGVLMAAISANPSGQKNRSLSERLSRANERRALRSLLRVREPGRTPHRRITPDMRRTLLGWAATISDEELLDMRNVGPVLLRWIRDHQPEDDGWQQRGQPDAEAGQARVADRSGERQHRPVSPWDREGNRSYPGPRDRNGKPARCGRLLTAGSSPPLPQIKLETQPALSPWTEERVKEALRLLHEIEYNTRTRR